MLIEILRTEIGQRAGRRANQMTTILICIAVGIALAMIGIIALGIIAVAWVETHSDEQGRRR